MFWKSCFYCNLPFSLPLDLFTKLDLGQMLSYQVLRQIQISFTYLFIYLFEMLSLALQLWLSSLAEVSIVQGRGPGKASGEGRLSLPTHEANARTTGVWLGNAQAYSCG